jgi:two-component system, cell cycle sensor histidine kinase and response regulator CckA
MASHVNQSGPGPDRLGALLDQISEGLQIIDPEYRYVYVNAAVCRHGRVSRDALIGRTMMEVYPGIERTEMFGRLTQCLRERRAVSMENEFSYPDGQRGWFDLRIEPVDEGALILSIDGTARKALEARYLHSQKMESLGLLAGGVAHDFNNLLSVILAYTHFLTRSLAADDRRRQEVGEIENAAHRASRLTRQLLAFSRQQVFEPRVLDLSEVVRGTEDMLRRLVGETVEFNWRLGDQLRRVFADAGQLEQVLVNLVVNARDAMPDGGRVTIETANSEIDQAYAERHFNLRAGRYVMLAVTDTGIGMDAETQRKIYDPFFTTKPAGKGTGLGLATAFGIVRQLGGDIWVYSEVGRGTTFKVFLPESTTAQVHAVPPSSSPADLRGDETILLVEDDPQVRAAAAVILRSLGYDVLVAGRPDEALRLAATASIDLLVSDIVLPQMSGIELARLLGADRPDLRLLYFSGYTEAVAVDHGLIEAGVAFLQKPFTAESLGARVRQVLDRDPNPLARAISS